MAVPRTAGGSWVRSRKPFSGLFRTSRVGTRPDTG